MSKGAGSGKPEHRRSSFKRMNAAEYGIQDFGDVASFLKLKQISLKTFEQLRRFFAIGLQQRGINLHCYLSC